MRKIITSHKLSFYLIAILLVLILVSAIIPQKDIASREVVSWREFLGDNYVIIEKLRLDRIYHSPVFFLVLGLFGINLTAVNIKRFRTVLRLEKTLLKARYLGSIIFHFSLLAVIGGVILNYLYKFEGVYGITEGQIVSDKKNDYFTTFKGPLYNEKYGRFDLILDKVYDEYKVKEAKTEAAGITLIPQESGDTIKSTILINRPLSWKELDLHFGLITGYSPEMEILDPDGNLVFRSFIRLITRRVGGRKTYSDYIFIPSEKLRVDLEVIPGDDTRYSVKVAKEKNSLYEDVLTAGDIARFDGYSLTIPSLRRWCYIDVVESPFLSLVFAGFWTAIGWLAIGMVPRFMNQMREKK